MTCLARYLVQPLRGAYLTIRIQTRQSASSEEKKVSLQSESSEEFKYFFINNDDFSICSSAFISFSWDAWCIQRAFSGQGDISVSHTQHTSQTSSTHSAQNCCLWSETIKLYWIKNKQLILFHICRQTCLNHDREEQRKVQHKKMCYT